MNARLVRRSSWLVAAALLAAPAVAWSQAPPAAAQRPIKRVLTIHSESEAFPGITRFDEVITKVLYAHPRIEVDYYAEFLEYEEFGVAADSSLREYIRLKFRDRPLDALIVDGAPAVQFALQHRAELFPDVPMVFVSAATPREVLEGKVARVTGVLRGTSHVETLDLALKLHPTAKRIHVVAYAPNFASYQESVKSALAAFSTRVTLTYSNEPSLREMLAAIKALPADSLILYARYSSATHGRVLFPEALLPEVVEAAPVPIYTSLDTYIGKGVVGGMMRNEVSIARRVGEMTAQILEGAKLEVMPVEAAPMSPIFDWRQVQRWRIDPSLLPVDSVIMFREPSVWALYGGYIFSAVAVLGLQSLLIIGLVYQRRARRRAEIESLSSEAEAQRLRREVAHVGRVSMMGQLASALAHEINQPLGAILRNAEAAELFMQNASPDLDEVRASLADIIKNDQRAGAVIDRMRALLKRHELEVMRLDVGDVIGDVVTIMRADAVSRHVKLDVAIAADLPPVRGDRVHLQQVLLNLVFNGMDALNGATQGDRRVTVTARPNGSRTVEIAVGDTGPGIPAEMLANVFDPFFSTKPNGMGMGLPISRTIVEAHGGQLWAENNNGHGATLRFTLPIAEEAAAG